MSSSPCPRRKAKVHWHALQVKHVTTSPKRSQRHHHHRLEAKMITSLSVGTATTIQRTHAIGLERRSFCHIAHQPAHLRRLLGFRHLHSFNPRCDGAVRRRSHQSNTRSLPFVLGYGVGPMVLSPSVNFQRLEGTGHTSQQCSSSFILNVVASLAPNYSTLMAMRFFTGFFGSPALATGGASIGDMFDGVGVAFPMAIWAVGAVCGRFWGLWSVASLP